MDLNERIKAFRVQLHLSQEYVAKYLGVSRSTFTQLENGKRKVTAEDITKLSQLFGTTTDELLSGSTSSRPSVVFARSFEKLDDRDQAEIMNLIRFKERLKEQELHHGTLNSDR